MMKYMKRAACFLLALVMALAMSVSAYAAEEGLLTGGKITVTGGDPKETYKLYQILVLDSFDDTGITTGADGNPSGGNYSYKANTDWAAFLNQADIKDIYFKVDPDTDAVTWAGTGTPTRQEVQVLAKKALKYAQDNSIAPVRTYTPTAGTTAIEFNNLKLGYYLLDSSLGSLCALDTTNTEINIQEKNTVPENTKRVQEDSDGTWGNVDNANVPFNDADIGQPVNFESTIKIRKGSENLCFHDEMSAGLTFGGVGSVKLTYSNVSEENFQTLPAVDYTVTADGDPADPFAADAGDKCTFHVKFTDKFYENLAAGRADAYQIKVSYTAILNERAVVCNQNSTAETGNPNESFLSYGESAHTTNRSKTLTKTWEFPVYKHTGEGAAATGLSNTEFQLFSKQGCAEADIIQLVLVNDGMAATPHTQAVYRRATAKDIADSTDTTIPEANRPKIVTTITTNKSGLFIIKGLDTATYYLKETKAADGYNKLKEPVNVVIANESGKTGVVKQNSTAVDRIDILNGTGAELPATGGIGTTVFYAVGGAMVLAAVVLLVTKKRMSD